MSTETALVTTEEQARAGFRIERVRRETRYGRLEQFSVYWHNRPMGVADGPGALADLIAWTLRNRPSVVM